MKSSLSNKVQIKLNTIMRTITKSGNRKPVKAMLQALDWMTFDQIIKYSKVMLLYKIVITDAAPFCKTLIHRGLAEQQQRYFVRERELRIAWRSRSLRHGDKSYLLTACKLYNDVKLLGKILTKRKLKDLVKTKIKSWR